MKNIMPLALGRGSKKVFVKILKKVKKVEKI
jgi:hypothetical protein